MSIPVIQLTGITRHYEMGGETVTALDGVDLEIASGEMIAIMGPSGSGKSTMMNILGCLDTPTSGVYLLDGRNVGALSDDQLSRVRGHQIGFIFQGYNLLARMTALANVELPMRLTPNGKNRRRTAMAALDRVGLADRAGHRPTELSGGQQQRVAIARALVNNPSMILADEPTGNLDSTSTESIIAVLQDLNRSDGITIVLVTHEEELASATRRVVRLRDGRIVEDGPVEQRQVISAANPAVPGPAS
ncbi:MAG: ABC transporter ATP-binding protein [Chloroflexi bacterium]|nr:ABC transporter ATP-binding protein [Chloroflexota bacterium]